MRISEAVEKNHEELFPNHKSALKVTDPELIEVFDNFAFDEVLQYGELDIKLRMKVILAARIAMQTLSEYKVMLGAALAENNLYSGTATHFGCFLPFFCV